MTFLDVGANLGNYTALTARAVGPNGQVIARWSPIPKASNTSSKPSPPTARKTCWHFPLPPAMCRPRCRFFFCGQPRHELATRCAASEADCVIGARWLPGSVLHQSQSPLRRVFSPEQFDFSAT
jgi:hypothetical protein